MHAAPPVEVSTAPAARVARPVAALIVAAAAVWGAWAASHWADGAGPGSPDGAAWILCATTGAAAIVVATRLLLRVARARTAALRWNGQEWSLADNDRSRIGHAQLMLDLGPWMLVRFRPGNTDGTPAGRSSAVWLPLRESRDPVRWAALRGALWNGPQS